MFDRKGFAERDSRAGGQVALGGFEGGLRRFGDDPSGRERFVDETVGVDDPVDHADAFGLGRVDAPAGKAQLARTYSGFLSHSAQARHVSQTRCRLSRGR
jgi:hypothetical protein